MSVKVTSNFHVRPLVTFFDIPQEARPDFTYMTIEETGEDRIFKYRGAYYDVQEFKVAGNDLKYRGFDGVQAQSAWDAIAVRYFDAEGYELWHDATSGRGVIVAHVTW